MHTARHADQIGARSLEHGGHLGRIVQFEPCWQSGFVHARDDRVVSLPSLALIARINRTQKYARPRTLPPYSSSRLFESGDRNSPIR